MDYRGSKKTELDEQNLLASCHQALQHRRPTQETSQRLRAHPLPQPLLQLRQIKMECPGTRNQISSRINNHKTNNTFETPME